MDTNGNNKKRQLTLDSFITKGKLDRSSCIQVSKTENHTDSKDGWGKLVNKGKEKDRFPVKEGPKYDNVNTSKDASSNKKCPFYKIVEGTTFIVDGFMHGEVEGISHYFLSHFHYDHYRGLRKSFRKPVYCSEVTANLVRLKIKIDDIYLRPLALNETYVVKGVQVILLDANHCPGAVMFVFKLPTGKCILHVGDFRASSDMEHVDLLVKNKIDLLYLDTTYLSSEYNFPKQDTILMHCARIVKQRMNENENTFFVIGSYSVGKEKVFKCVASALNSLIYADEPKSKLLMCLSDDDISNKLSRDKDAARVHVVSMHLLQMQKLEEYRKSLKMCQVLVAFKPTGWEHTSITSNSDAVEQFIPRKSGSILLYGIPYSEHSSYEELRRFVQFIKPRKIIQTVYDKSLKERAQLLTNWVEEAGRF